MGFCSSSGEELGELSLRHFRGLWFAAGLAKVFDSLLIYVNERGFYSMFSTSYLLPRSAPARQRRELIGLSKLRLH